MGYNLDRNANGSPNRNCMAITDVAKVVLKDNCHLGLYDTIYKNGQWQYDKITVELSICGAARLLTYLQNKAYHTDLYDAVKNYNGDNRMASGGYCHKVLYVEKICRICLNPQKVIAQGTYPLDKLANELDKEGLRSCANALYW